MEDRDWRQARVASVARSLSCLGVDLESSEGRLQHALVSNPLAEEGRTKSIIDDYIKVLACLLLPTVGVLISSHPC